ncbi:MAG: SPOR domain-containing protein [Halobacteriovoraceae bacterium]|jgi:cell division protein FtsN|nr:SPOR domain-containing protein [Halobacteriovoraceae bacterium]
MDEKAKLFVFAKKEVFLIFLFMLLIATTSFVFGVKVGKKFSFQREGFTTEDREKVDLLSGQEEKVHKQMEEDRPGEKTPQELQQEMHDNLRKKIEREFTQEEAAAAAETQKKNEIIPAKAIEPVAKIENPKKIVIPVTESTPENAPPSSTRDKYSGKYTIQLSSHRTLNEAEEFAKAFKIRGYNPIINEVEVKSRGTWYRVSLGVFANLAETKEYVLKEKELFMGQDYVFIQFD